MFRPLDRNVLLKIKKIEKNINGLYLPNKDSDLYEVINIGKEVVELKIGDKVYVDINKLAKIIIGNEEYYIIDEKDVYLVVEE